MQTYNDLRAVYLNCSLKDTGVKSHTQRLMGRSASIMHAVGVAVENVHVRAHHVMFGMTKDASTDDEQDAWPEIHAKVMQADILVIGTPIWLGAKSSVASLVLERLYAYSGDTNEKGQYLYYGKVGGCLVTGNEDGVKHVGRDVLYSLQHIGFTIPPQADAGWIGEVGPGPSYGDAIEGDTGAEQGVGFASEFTNQNTTYMTWNLIHMARLLKDNGGLPGHGNNKDWKKVPNATDFTPERVPKE